MLHFKAEMQVPSHEEDTSYPVSYSWLCRGRLAKGDGSHDYYSTSNKTLKSGHANEEPQLPLYHMQDTRMLISPPC